jgi:hypothetical protein
LCLSERSDDKQRLSWLHHDMLLRATDVLELADALPLAIDPAPYRERLSPLAVAVLQGEARKTIDRRRELVLPDVWDQRLRDAALEAISALRKELTRKAAVLDSAILDLEQPARKSAMARAVVDRILADLLDANDANIEALAELERELEETPVDERAGRAALAARGAYVAARIPANDVRAAVVRTARAMQRVPANEDGAEYGARFLARRLASDERRRAAREWVATLANESAEHVPLLADELRDLAAVSASSAPEDDLIWVQACIGLSFEYGLSQS